MLRKSVYKHLNSLPRCPRHGLLTMTPLFQNIVLKYDFVVKKQQIIGIYSTHIRTLLSASLSPEFIHHTSVFVLPKIRTQVNSEDTVTG